MAEEVGFGEFLRVSKAKYSFLQSNQGILVSALSILASHWEGHF